MSRRFEDSFIFLYCPLVSTFPTIFCVDNIAYHSSYQHYEAAKAQHFDDYQLWHDIILCPVTDEIRKMTMTVKNFCLDNWNNVAVDYMKVSLQYKFWRNDLAREYLCSTGDLRLVFANGDEPFWGTGLDFMDERNHDPKQWKGHNVLGAMLENVRSEINKM